MITAMIALEKAWKMSDFTHLDIQSMFFFRPSLRRRSEHTQSFIQRPEFGKAFHSFLVRPGRVI